ncbi:unnamed protein product [Rotaria sp. Silwood2]|nr:unnamed protein product [Rotaria sp. Silwood2]CAF2983146.1 unnamed protein product [Rotaria sp. Silwood2]CAF3316523.1 unnamed protein product [Rotaria sp. Silwood2]
MLKATPSGMSNTSILLTSSSSTSAPSPSPLPSEISNDTSSILSVTDDLSEELEQRGFIISRSATYLRLMPRQLNTSEGKRHVSTIPVKLVRAHNTGRCSHADSYFAAATVEYLKDLATLFGLKSVFVMIQDDNARVPFGIPAAKQQAPLLMQFWNIVSNYQIMILLLLKKNKLIPSHDPTYIGIRFSKHDHSTAFTHLAELSKFLSLTKFKHHSHMDNNELKPIFILFIDSDLDENPRFPKARQC